MRDKREFRSPDVHPQQLTWDILVHRGDICSTVFLAHQINRESILFVKEKIKGNVQRLIASYIMKEGFAHHTYLHQMHDTINTTAVDHRDPRDDSFAARSMGSQLCTASPATRTTYIEKEPKLVAIIPQ